MQSFNFKSQAKNLDPQLTTTQYPCFFCQIESFGRFQNLQKNYEHARQFSPQLSWLYLTLLQIHDPDYSTNGVTQKLSSRKQLSRVHPNSHFHFWLARGWVENLQPLETHLKILYLKSGITEIWTVIVTSSSDSHLYNNNKDNNDC